MDSLLQNTRYALRTLARTPAFTLVDPTAADTANVFLAVVVVVTVALAACTLPAYRAIQIDPLMGIREE